MANMLTAVLKVGDLRRKVFYTLMCMVVFRIGAYITTPGIDPSGLADLTQRLSQSNFGGLIGYFDLFVGGAFEKFTIFALGLMPYISASIFMQLMTAVVPHLEKLSKEGESGRKQIQRYVRYATIIICAVQSGFISNWIASHEGVLAADLADKKALFTVIAVVSITTGTMFLMWLGDQITERGVGNGISLIIFAGIAARIPIEFVKTLNSVQEGVFNPVGFMAVLLVFAAVIFFVVYEQQGQRRIPVQFAKKVVGRKVYGAQSTYLPFKINPTGVIPIIFASAVVMLPVQLAQMLGDRYPTIASIAINFSPGHMAYVFVYGFLVIGFAYMYTSVQFNPVEIAEDLKRRGGYIPGIRPGAHTQEYLQRVLMRITLAGSVFLALIAVFPDLLLRIQLFEGMPTSFIYLMGGTSLLILVSVDLDTMQQIESQLMMREYEGFMTKKKRRPRRQL